MTLDVATDERASDGTVRRRAMIFFIYLLFGPPIGGFIVIHGFLVFSFAQTGFSGVFPEFTVQNSIQIFLWPIWSIFLSLLGYIFGGIQAGITGLILAIVAKKNCSFSYQTAIVATIPSSILAILYFGLDGNGEWFFTAMLGGLSIVASLIVRFLFRKRFSGAYEH